MTEAQRDAGGRHPSFVSIALRSSPWPTPHRVALLTYTLADATMHSPVALMEQWMGSVCDAAHTLGWDTSAHVVCTGIHVPREWLLGVTERVDLHALHGVTVATADGARNVLAAAAHACACGLVRFHERQSALPKPLELAIASELSASMFEAAGILCDPASESAHFQATLRAACGASDARRVLGRALRDVSN